MKILSPDLRGAKFASIQTVELASLLGVEIVE